MNDLKTNRNPRLSEDLSVSEERDDTGDIVLHIDLLLAKRKMSVTELADRVGITLTNLSILKNGKAKAIKFSTLSKLCQALDCQPGDLLEYVPHTKE